VFDEVLIIETALTEVSKIRLNFKYRIHKHDGPEVLPSELSSEALPGRPAVTGETFHCAVNLQGRPVPMEATLFEKLSSLRGSL
jgi:acyl-CoA thioesterase FadM